MFENKRSEETETPSKSPPPDGYLPTPNRADLASESPTPNVLRLSGHVARRKPPRTEEFLWDSEVPGFCARCSPTGHKSWIVRFRERGRKRFLTLGKVGEMSAEAARAEARQRLARNALDGLPVPKPASPCPGLTLAQFTDEFVSIHSRNWKPRTFARSVWAIRQNILPALGHITLKELARADIARWRDSMASRPGLFNRALPVLSSMCKLAEQLGYRPKGSNPRRNTSIYPRKPKERFLSPSEYRALARVLEGAEGQMPDNVAVIRLLAFTGARVGEIAGLRWEWIKGSADRKS